MHKGEGSQCHTEGWRQLCFIRVVQNGEGSVGHVEGGVQVTHCGEGTGEKTERQGKELGMNF